MAFELEECSSSRENLGATTASLELLAGESEEKKQLTLD